MSWAICKSGLEMLERESEQKNSSAEKHIERRHSKKNKRLNHYRIIKNSSVKLYEQSYSVDETEKNIKALEKIDKLSSDIHSLKVKKHVMDQLEKRKAIDGGFKRQKKETTKSVFSEEDFEKMNDVWLALS